MCPIYDRWERWNGVVRKARWQRARSTAEGVAARVVEAVDDNKLYVVPQLEARVSRLFKRLAPTLSTNLMGSAYARQERRDAGKR